jgi:hypothetical protein
MIDIALAILVCGTIVLALLIDPLFVVGLLRRAMERWRWEPAPLPRPVRRQLAGDGVLAHGDFGQPVIEWRAAEPA